jgi:hypothetical protein
MRIHSRPESSIRMDSVSTKPLPLPSRGRVCHQVLIFI